MYNGSYKNGDEEGIWEFYDDSGLLMYKRIYKNGIIISIE
jgi:antitoxin component YwqK of YwqJK toxin-antitoxin module